MKNAIILLWPQHWYVVVCLSCFALSSYFTVLYCLVLVLLDQAFLIDVFRYACPFFKLANSFLVHSSRSIMPSFIAVAAPFVVSVVKSFIFMCFLVFIPSVHPLSFLILLGFCISDCRSLFGSAILIACRFSSFMFVLVLSCPVLSWFGISAYLLS